MNTVADQETRSLEALLGAIDSQGLESIALSPDEAGKLCIYHLLNLDKHLKSEQDPQRVERLRKLLSEARPHAPGYPGPTSDLNLYQHFQGMLKFLVEKHWSGLNETLAGILDGAVAGFQELQAKPSAQSLRMRLNHAQQKVSEYRGTHFSASGPLLIFQMPRQVLPATPPVPAVAPPEILVSESPVPVAPEIQPGPAPASPRSVDIKVTLPEPSEDPARFDPPKYEGVIGSLPEEPTRKPPQKRPSPPVEPEDEAELSSLDEFMMARRARLGDFATSPLPKQENNAEGADVPVAPAPVIIRGPRRPLKKKSTAPVWAAIGIGLLVVVGGYYVLAPQSASTPGPRTTSAKAQSGSAATQSARERFEQTEDDQVLAQIQTLQRPEGASPYDPLPPDNLAEIANLYMGKLHDTKQAALHYEEIIHRYPDWARDNDIYRLLATCYETEEDYTAAASIYFKMINIYAEESPEHIFAQERMDQLPR